MASAALLGGWAGVRLCIVSVAGIRGCGIEREKVFGCLLLGKTAAS